MTEDQQNEDRRGAEAASGRFEIVNNLGLHARAATKLVQLASRFACDIEISRDGQKANAKSVMGVLLLCGGKGTIVEVTARGPSSEEAVQAIGRLIASKFGESS
jgi:phosphocarrier protein HPr